MKLKEITVHKDKTRKLTIKGRLGGYKSDEVTGGITMTFSLEDGEELRDEVEIAREANEKVTAAVNDLVDPDEAKWLKTTPEKKDDYKEVR